MLHASECTVYLSVDLLLEKFQIYVVDIHQLFKHDVNVSHFLVDPIKIFVILVYIFDKHL